MNMFLSKEVKIKRVREGAILPTRASTGAAGYDLYACISEPVEIKPHDLCKIPTGIAIALPDPYTVGLIFARSGLGVKHGIAPANAVGVIDSDYRGEIMVGLCNLGSEPYTLSPGERFAQLVIMPVCDAKLEETDDLGETERGSSGFGSTGKN
ncbi:dUTP diphosphatase [Thermocaproicibacter melissae]|nr:dUTP diphosphatase [Thermocaproicibacter melissae]WBY64169.1 dUTP diphosphatase [Thermocaproicibacter melissae]